MLLAISTPHDPDLDAVARFARNRAWTHRRLSTALAGYAQIKHNLILYNAQEYGSECDGGGYGYTSFYEVPIVPDPKGFVEPSPEVFARIIKILRHLNTLSGEEVIQADAIEMIELLVELAQISKHKETLGKLPSLRSFGAQMEALFMELYPSGTESARLDHGISLIADIFNDVQTAQILHIAVGRALPIFVVVPDVVGERVTQGGILSFYELWSDERLTDDLWHKRLGEAPPPPLPPWTESFVEPAPAAKPRY